MISIVTVGRLDPCVLLAFGAPVEQVRPLVPAPLRPVERNGSAFWNVVVCRVDKMRPLGFPRALGLSYIHVAYRIHVTCPVDTGETLRGLYFVRSDVDQSIIVGPGNRTSDFRFHRSDIALKASQESLDVSVRSTGGYDASLNVVSDANLTNADDPLLKYQPLNLGCDPGGSVVRLAEVFREEQAWCEQPVRVSRQSFEFFGTMKQDVRLLRATRVNPIDYQWRLGHVRQAAFA